MTKLEIGARRLSNGLRLLAVRNPGVTTFACGVSLAVDVRNEDPRQSGIANLVGESLEEGTRRRDGDAFAEAVEGIGGGFEGNLSGAMAWAPAAAAGRLLPLVREAVTEPAFPAAEVARVRDEVLSDILAEQEDPRAVAALAFRREVYGAHPFARPVKGTKQTLGALRPRDLRAFHQRWFVPQRGYVAAAGPFEVERMLDMLSRAWRSFRGVAHERPGVVEPVMPATKREMHLPMPREQVHVYLGHPGVRRVHPDYYALSVMDHVLGTGPGFTSRVTKKLRDEMGLYYTVFAGITQNAGEEPGTFTSYIGTSAEHREKAVKVFLAEMRAIRKDAPNGEELRAVQDYLCGSFVLGLERNTSLVRYAVLCDRFDLGFDHLERYPGYIRSITAEDVQRVAAEHLQPDRVVVVSAGAG